MENENHQFNDFFREKTKNLALMAIKLYEELKNSEATRIIGKQLLRSSTSVAANFRASCRARSPAEHYSKLCIVIEECDETAFWIELLESSNLMTPEDLQEIKLLTFKILAAMAKTRKVLKNKL